MALNIPLPEVITDLGRVVIEQSYDALSKRSNIVYYLKKSGEKVPVLTISTGYLPTDFMGILIMSGHKVMLLCTYLCNQLVRHLKPWSTVWQ